MRMRLTLLELAWWARFVAVMVVTAVFSDGLSGLLIALAAVVVFAVVGHWIRRRQVQGAR